MLCEVFFTKNLQISASAHTPDGSPQCQLCIVRMTLVFCDSNLSLPLALLEYNVTQLSRQTLQVNLLFTTRQLVSAPLLLDTWYSCRINDNYEHIRPQTPTENSCLWHFIVTCSFPLYPQVPCSITGLTRVDKSVIAGQTES